MVLLSPSLSLTNLHFFRNRGSTAQSPKGCGLHEKMIVCSSSPSKLISLSQNGFWRRDLVLFGLSSSVSLVFPSRGSLAEEDLKMASMVDDINAYSYLYPVELPSKKFLFKCLDLRPRIDYFRWIQTRDFYGRSVFLSLSWHRVESRKPERYSSAAPLSPDARLRIVSERVDIIDNLIISVSIGPPNFQLLKSKEKSAWSAKDVADSVLSDKSALRVTTSQRMEESSVLETHSSEIDGESYWYYEYLVRKSPSNIAQESNLYRHYVASTAERDGYLYSLSASTLSKQWNKMGPLLEKTVSSFRLLPPTDNYVPPYKDPWRFW